MNNHFQMVLGNETKFLLSLKWKHNMVNKILKKKFEVLILSNYTRASK